MKDPTWKKEQNYFLNLIKRKKNSLKKEIWINSILNQIKYKI